MRGFFQIVCVLFFSIGAGLFSFGNYLEPKASDLSAFEIATMNRDLRDAQSNHIVASTARGFGIGLMTFGGLGLIVPWVNGFMTYLGKPAATVPYTGSLPPPPA